MSTEVAKDEPAVAKLLVELSSALDVQYERGNALEAKCAALAEENAGLKEACGGDGSYRDCPACANSEYIEAPETPYTDDFLAEVRDSARNDFIGRIEWIIRNECNPDKTEAIINELQNFSDQLKLEAAQ